MMSFLRGFILPIWLHLNWLIPDRWGSYADGSRFHLDDRKVLEDIALTITYRRKCPDGEQVTTREMRPGYHGRSQIWWPLVIWVQIHASLPTLKLFKRSYTGRLYKLARISYQTLCFFVFFHLRCYVLDWTWLYGRLQGGGGSVNYSSCLAALRWFLRKSALRLRIPVTASPKTDVRTQGCDN